MRIGILGGTFDPIHNGHLALAHAACKQLKLDEIYFVPASQNPYKSNVDMDASAEHRVEMVRLAIVGDKRFKLSLCELERGGISYTVDTIRDFKHEFPEPNKLFFITGGDWGKQLDGWKEIDEIFRLATFVVAKRPGFSIEDLSGEVHPLEFVPLDISSTEIKKQIMTGEIAKEVLPNTVYQYILKHGLYQR